MVLIGYLVWNLFLSNITHQCYSKNYRTYHCTIIVSLERNYDPILMENKEFSKWNDSFSMRSMHNNSVDWNNEIMAHCLILLGLLDNRWLTYNGLNCRFWPTLIGISEKREIQTTYVSDRGKKSHCVCLVSTKNCAIETYEILRFSLKEEPSEPHLISSEIS